MRLDFHDNLHLLLNMASWNKMQLVKYMMDGKARTRKQIEENWNQIADENGFSRRDDYGKLTGNKKIRNYLKELVDLEMLSELDPLEDSFEKRYLLNQ